MIAAAITRTEMVIVTIKGWFKKVQNQIQEGPNFGSKLVAAAVTRTEMVIAI